MKKIKVSVKELVNFNHEIIIEVPSGVDIDEMLDKAERGMFFDDAIYTFEKFGCKILDVSKDDDGSCEELEIPCYDDENSCN